MMVQIAVVSSGDSLWSIANRYGISVDELAKVNELSKETGLVLGQSLVIPTSNRIVNEYFLSRSNLQRATIEVNAYIRATDPNAVNEVNKYAPYLTYFSVSSYRATASGNITAVNDTQILNAIEKTNSKPILVITNFTGEKFSPDVTRALFTNNEVKEKFVTNLLAILAKKPYFAVNFDFEENYPEDRELYNQFLRDITPRIKEKGILVSTTLAPKTSPTTPVAWFGGLDHDYAAHGEIVDFVNLMTYDIGGWFSGAPAPVSPLPKVREVLNYAVSVIPNEKILLGLPLYGYDWRLPFDPATDIAETIGPREAINRARDKGAKIEYDANQKAPFYTYYDNQKKQHIVWFEDARSMKAKLDLINEFSLRGASYFILGRPFPENWALISEMFTVKKY